MDELSFRILSPLFDTTRYFAPIKRLLKAEEHRLQKLSLVDNACDNGLKNSEVYTLTDKACDELLACVEASLPVKNDSSFLHPEDIIEKALFYPEKTAKQIDELSLLLSQEKFSAIQENLTREGMRSGFACLFSGGPGTGKTETALQIAKATGRAIMKVDIAETQSKWFGESEKQIKAIFKKYRRAVKRYSAAPILLFNEADAVISKRKTLTGNETGPRQTENRIQNIILEEIENLTGILIATTNLTENMDKAFERRFLYKITFEKPEPKTRAAIWQSNLKSLSPADAASLASRFEFSGGQIENIVRKQTAFRIVHGEAPSFSQILDYCKNETAEGKGAKPLGFQVCGGQ